MSIIKRNYGWVIVVLLASLPLIPLSSFLSNVISEGANTLDGKSSIDMLYHISGEFAIRWMTAVLTLTPFFILFGVTNLFVRQAMGISTAIWSFLHFIIFIWADGFFETFTQVNYIAGFLAILMLIPMAITSNRKSMKFLKTKWKKLQSLVYAIVALSLLHIILLDKTWLIYGIIVGLGFIIRMPAVKGKIIKIRLNRKNETQ